MTALKKSSRSNFRMNSEVQVEERFIEPIDEQAREESPTKSERNSLELEFSQRRSTQAVDSTEYDLKLPDMYHCDDHQNTTVKSEVKNPDGKIQRIYLNGKKEVVFSNRVRRETFPDGYTIVHFTNGDIK